MGIGKSRLTTSSESESRYENRVLDGVKALIHTPHYASDLGMHRKTTSSAAQGLSRLVLAWNSWPIVGLPLKGRTRLDGIIGLKSTNQPASCRGARGWQGVRWKLKRLDTVP
jgi:hypothetical protein